MRDLMNDALSDLPDPSPRLDDPTPQGLPKGDAMGDSVVELLAWVASRAPQRALALVDRWVDELGAEIAGAAPAP